MREGLEAQIAAAGSHAIAAVIVEPVAFAGGVIVPPSGFLEMLALLGERHGMLLIVDEIITGFGRCVRGSASSARARSVRTSSPWPRG